MSDKEHALRAIERLPDTATFEQIMAELYFREKVERGLRDVAEGRVVSQEVASQRLTRWLPK